MATVLEARAIITAEDKTAAAFAAIESRMAALSKAAANMGRVASAAAAASNMANVAAPMAQASKAVSTYASAMSEAARQSAVFASAQKNVGAAIELGSRAASRAQAMYRAKSYAGTAGMIATPFIAHEAVKLAGAVKETYREFDKERRFAKAVMGISDEEQAPLIKQAIHGGATTKYNDIQFLEAQRELAARGLKRDQILGFMPAAADLGQSLGLDLPSSVRQMEGAIFGFKKNLSTTEAAARSARETADLQVKAAKISGMTPEDITQLYKFGATPSRLAGVSEQNLLAFGAISKKANMGGDEAGVAFRALMAAATSPTAGAKTAMRANGMRYADYQRNPDKLALDPFVGDVAERYGVKLNKAAKDAIAKVFSSKDMISSPEKFTPAITAALRGSLGGKDAKSLKSIAGEANRYRAASMQGVDVNALIRDLMIKLPGNLQFANALFGREQGARISNAFGDPATFKHMLDELDNHSAGYAEKVSTERMAGFDGAVSRFEGAIKNVETALGRSTDKQLTGAYDVAGKSLQWFAELPDSAHRAAIELGAIAAAAVTATGAIKAFSIANRLDGGPGVKGPGLGGALGFLWKGAMLYNLGSDLWDTEEMKKKFFNNKESLSDKVDSWGSKNLPSWIGSRAELTPADIGSYKDAPSGYGRDFTLGSSGFSKLGRLQPPSNLGYMSNWDASHVAPGPLGKGTETVNVTGEATIDNNINIKVEASPELKAIVADVQKMKAMIPLSSTGHAKSALGPSMPEAAPTGQSGAP